MKRQILILLLSFIISDIFCQSIEYFKLLAGVSFLPSANAKGEEYIYKDGTLRHYLYIYHGKKLKQQKLCKTKNIFNQITILDSLLNVDEFTITTDTLMKNAIYGIKDKYDFYYKDIDTFFSNNNVITLKLKDIVPDPFESGPIDGRSFRIIFEIKKSGQDTIKYIFDDNIDSSPYIQPSKIKFWLPFYICYQNDPVFKKIHFDKYFDRECLIRVIANFIKWQNNK